MSYIQFSGTSTRAKEDKTGEEGIKRVRKGCFYCHSHVSLLSSKKRNKKSNDKKKKTIKRVTKIKLCFIIMYIIKGLFLYYI